MLQSNRSLILLCVLIFATASFAGCHEPSGGDGGDGGNGGGNGDGGNTTVTTTPGGGGTLRIGFLLPLTGDAASLGVPAAQGARLAVEQINRDGGIGGRTLELVEGDTKYPSQTEPVTEFERIAGQGVQFIVGALASDSSEVVKSRATEAEVVMVSPASTRPSLTGPDHGYFFRVIANDTVQGPQAARILYEDLGQDSAVVMYQQTGYAMGLKDQFIPAYEDLGGTLNGEPIAFSEDETTYDARAADAVNRNPQHIWIASQVPDMAHMIKALRDQGYEGEILASEAIESEEVFGIACDEVNGVQFTKAAPEQGPALVAFNSNYTARYSEEPGAYSAFAYDAVFVGAAAIAGAGDDGPAIKQWMENNPVSGRVTTDTVRFNANGDITTGGYTLWQVTCAAGQGAFTPA